MKIKKVTKPIPVPEKEIKKVIKPAPAIEQTKQAIRNMGYEPAAIIRGRGRPKKKQAQGETVYSLGGPKKVRELKVGDTVIYSAEPCQVHRLGKCLDKTKPEFVMVSLVNHPIHPGLTLPCLKDDIFYTKIEGARQAI